VYKYRDLLCFSVFNSLRPQPRFDETRYPNTLDKPVPAGTRITEGSPSDAILPAHALKTVSRLLSERCGKPITLLPRLFEMPQIDDLFRIKLNSGLGNLPPRERGHLNAVGIGVCLMPLISRRAAATQPFGGRNVRRCFTCHPSSQVKTAFCEAAFSI